MGPGGRRVTTQGLEIPETPALAAPIRKELPSRLGLPEKGAAQLDIMGETAHAAVTT